VYIEMMTRVQQAYTTGNKEAKRCAEENIKQALATYKEAIEQAQEIREQALERARKIFS